jgi:hypothetical protein
LLIVGHLFALCDDLHEFFLLVGGVGVVAVELSALGNVSLCGESVDEIGGVVCVRGVDLHDVPLIRVTDFKQWDTGVSGLRPRDDQVHILVRPREPKDPTFVHRGFLLRGSLAPLLQDELEELVVEIEFAGVCRGVAAKRGTTAEQEFFDDRWLGLRAEVL